MGIEQGRRVLSGTELLIDGLSIFGHSIGSDSGLPMMAHKHKAKAEIVIVLKGSLEYDVNGKELFIYSGEALFTPPDAQHYSGETTSERNEILWMQIDLSAGERLLGLSSKEAIYIGRTILGLGAKKVVLPTLLMSKIAEAFVLLSNDSIHDKIKGRGLFLYSVLSLFELWDNKAGASNDIGAARQYIAEHIKESIDMGELLQASGLNSDTLKQRFEQELETTPREYITKVKIETAKKMVALTNRSIVDIAFEYSFPSNQAFCAAFKKHCQMSPKAYRRNYIKGKIEF